MLEGFKLEPLPLRERAVERANSLNSTQVNISCHCCDDTGSIDAYKVSRYLIQGYTNLEPAIRCQRPDCEANTVWVEVNGSQVMQPRYSDQCFDSRVTPEICDRIHHAEIERIQKAKASGERPVINLSTIGRSIQ